MKGLWKQFWPQMKSYFIHSKETTEITTNEIVNLMNVMNVVILDISNVGELIESHSVHHSNEYLIQQQELQHELISAMNRRQKKLI